MKTPYFITIGFLLSYFYRTFTELSRILSISTDRKFSAVLPTELPSILNQLQGIHFFPSLTKSQWTNNFDWSQKKTQKKICFLWGWIWFLFFSFSHQIVKKYNKIAGSIWKRKGTRLHTRNINHKCYQVHHLAFIISFPLQSLKGLFWFLKSP